MFLLDFMERLPQYWAVRNDESDAFKNSVIKYVESKHDWLVRPHFSAFTINRFTGKGQQGYFFNLTSEELHKRKEVVVLPLHLFETLVANELKPKSMRRSVNPVPPNGRITGYILKDGVSNEAALRALGVSKSSRMFHNTPSIPIAFEINTSLYYDAVRFGVLDLLFTPQYKKEPTTVIVRHKNGHLNAIIEEGRVTIDGQRFSTADVQRIVAPHKINGISFTPTSFTTGCNNQYEGISREDIIQVLDVLTK